MTAAVIPTLERRLLGGNWKIRPAAGLYFKREWCAVVDAIPADLDVVRYWDLAATEKTEFNDPDWTVGIKLGRDKNGGYWLLDMVRARANPGDVERLLINIAAQDGNRVRIGFGQDPGQLSCRTTSNPAASAMATEASALPPSTASTSAGGGSSAASERNSRGSPAASFSMGMTMATPVIAFGSLQRPGPARQIVRTVEVGETFQHGGNDPPAPTGTRLSENASAGCGGASAHLRDKPIIT